MKKKIITKNSYNEKNLKTVKNNEFLKKSKNEKIDDKKKLDLILKNFLKSKNNKKNFCNKKKHFKQNSLNHNGEFNFEKDIKKIDDKEKNLMKQNLLSSRI